MEDKVFEANIVEHINRPAPARKVKDLKPGEKGMVDPMAIRGDRLNPEAFLYKLDPNKLDLLCVVICVEEGKYRVEYPRKRYKVSRSDWKVW